MDKKVKGSLAAVAAGLCFGVIPLILLGISRAGTVSGTVCSMYRLFFASLATMPFSLHRLRKRPEKVKTLLKVFLIGATTGCTALCLYEAFERIPSGIAIAVNYIYPLVTLFIAAVVLKQKVSRAALPAALLVLAGVILLCDVTVLPDKPVAGLLFAFASAVLCSIYYTLLAHLDTGSCDPLVLSTLVNLSGGFAMLVFNLLTGSLTADFAPAHWGLMFLAGLVMVGAVMSVTFAVRNVGTVTATILGTLEPIICTLGSALLLNDPVTPRTLTGAALILSAVVLITVTGRKE